MKRIMIILFILIIGIQLFSANAIWSKGTTNTIPQGRWEVGIFQPLSYGLSENTELSTYVLADFVLPNITIKRFWKETRFFKITSKHSLLYPTPLLNLIAKEGAGGILPDNSKIPDILVLNHQFMFSHRYNDRFCLIPKIGFSSSLISGRKDFPTIDLPLVYNRTYIYHYDSMLNIGFDLRGNITEDLEFIIDIDKFIMDKDYCKYSYEHKLMLFWKINRRFALSGGYKMTISDYPSSLQRNVDIFPLLDFQLGIN